MVAANWTRVDDAADQITSIITNAQSIACLAHKDADADSLGSALAFVLSLRQMGRTIQCVVPEPMPELLTHLPGFELASTKTPAQVDALFTFDCATLGRFGEKRALVESTPVVVNIDHHLGNEAFGTLNVVESDASATGQVVFRLLRTIGAPITPDVAANLYAALLTDTGGFRHENTTEAALRMGADLVSLGADPAFIALKSYKSRSFAQMKLEGLSIAAMEADCDGRLVYTKVTPEMLATAGASSQESEGIVDVLQSVSTMCIAILFKQTAPGAVKISVRTRDNYDSTELCRAFGGGGHRRAAGAELAMTLEEAQKAVLEYARGMLEKPA